MQTQLLFTLFITLTSISAFADSSRLLIDGNHRQETLELSSEVHHTEYRTETREKTCYSQEFDHNETVCQTIQENQCRTQRVCTTNPDGSQNCHDETACRPVPREICHQEARYRTVPYTCYEQVQVPFTVHDFDTLTQVTVNVGDAPRGVRLNELLKIDLDGESLSVSAARTSQQVFIFMRKDTSVVSRGGGVERLQSVVNLRFLNRNELLSPLSGGMQDMKINGKLLQFTTGLIVKADQLGMSLRVKTAKAIFKDDILFERSLNKSEFQIQAEGNRSLITIDLEKIGALGKFKKGKNHKVKPTVYLGIPTENLLNSQDLPSNEVTSEQKLGPF